MEILQQRNDSIEDLIKKADKFFLSLIWIHVLFVPLATIGFGTLKEGLVALIFPSNHGHSFKQQDGLFV